MQEKPEIEQYFFDRPTLAHLARFASGFPDPCCLCTPSLGEELEKLGIQATTLDIDSRFAHLRGFRPYDISKPVAMPERFGIIVCDPPFLNVSLMELLHAVEVLSMGNYEQPLLVNYLSSRSRTICRVFAPFNLKPTGYRPGYMTIQNIGRNEMEFFGNIGPDRPLKPPLPSFLSR